MERHTVIPITSPLLSEPDLAFLRSLHLRAASALAELPEIRHRAESLCTYTRLPRWKLRLVTMLSDHYGCELLLKKRVCLYPESPAFELVVAGNPLSVVVVTEVYRWAASRCHGFSHFGEKVSEREERRRRFVDAIAGVIVGEPAIRASTTAAVS